MSEPPAAPTTRDPSSRATRPQHAGEAGPAPVDAPTARAEAPDRFAWRSRIRRNPGALFWYRIGVGIVGGLLMLAAALTGWLPGPGGIPLFLLGLAVWASEFVWAKRLMDWFIGLFAWFGRIDPRTKKVLVGAVILAAIGTWYGVAAVAGLPEWLPDPVADGLHRLPGL